MKKLVAALLCGVGLQAQATTLQYKDMNTMVREADGIVAGTVREVVSQRGDDNQLYTYVTLSDLDVIGGRYGGSELTLILKGGFDGEHGLAVEGSPEFGAAERVVLMVAGNGQRIVPIVGWGQGTFKMSKDAAGNEIVTDSVGNEIYDVKENGEVIKADHAHARARLIDSASGLAVKSATEGKFEPGHSDDGSMVRVLRVVPSGKPMSSARFLAQMRKRAAARAYPAAMNSVAVGASLRAPAQDGARPGSKPSPAESMGESVAPAGRNAKPVEGH